MTPVTRRSVDTRTAAPVPQRVHLVGVGGVGMAGIARLLLQRGHDVSGSDLRDGKVLDELRRLGATITVGHDGAAIAGAQLVVVSSAVPESNPEVVAAREAGVEVVMRARTLADLLADDRAVLVAGTHGKTTTTAMCVVALQAAGVDPTFVIGGQLNETGASAHGGADAVAVAEADESDRSFLAYEPDVAVVTNLELDHPDEYGDDDDVHAAFVEFLGRVRDGGTVVLCLDDPGAAALRAHVPDGIEVLTYGYARDATLRMEPGGPRSATVHGPDGVVTLELQLPGAHNLRNATAALATAHALGADAARAAEGLGTFGGTQRRFQRLGTAAGVQVVDDYAHHPTELRATIEAARSEQPRRLVVVVQPHRFSRTAVFGDDLGRAAAAADVVVVTEVYAGGEQPRPGVTGARVADAARQAGAEVRFEPHLSDVPAVLEGLVEEGDLVLVTGAGDVTRVGPALLDRLRSRRV